MSFRPLALLLTFLALIVGLLVTVPVQSASHNLTVSTYNVAINANGYGRVRVACHSDSACRGGIWIEGDYDQVQHYAVKAHSFDYIMLKIDTTHDAYPYGPGDEEGVYGDNGPRQLVVKETGPKFDQHEYTILPQIKVASQVITGTVTAKGDSPVSSGVKVELVRIRPGGGVESLKFDKVSNGGTYSHAVPLGTNNVSSAEYELRISDDSGRSWFWRGTNGSARGGGRYITEATKVVANKLGAYRADFTYGSISGTARRDTLGGDPLADTSITVAATPVSFGSTRTNLDLDIPNCANIYGEAQTDDAGNYTIGFLPYGGPTKRYLVQADPRPAYPNTTKLALWNNEHGSCQNATGYDHSTANLIDLSSGLETQDFAVRESTNTLYVNAAYPGMSPTYDGDRWVRVREKVPGVAVLNAPIVAEGQADKGGAITFNTIPRGLYWVETGRRTSCNDWYASRFSNNSAYFQGADRGAEAWKTVSGAKEEYAKSVAMGYVRKTPPKGYKGWMYRGYCRTYGAGAYTVAAFHGNDSSEYETSTPTVKRGAIVKGRVSRSGGRTNKEMMVRLSSSGGTLVYRTHFTDGGGNFTIYGLASGTYRISVNSDSWRGIGRTFGGKETIKVTAGKTYNVGTLSFKS